MVYAAVVRRDIVGVEKDALLYFETLDHGFVSIVQSCIHLLKLVTGVDTSTRPESRSGRVGKTAGSARRTAAAAPKRSSFWLTDMANPRVLSWHQSHDGCNGPVELRVCVEHPSGPLHANAGGTSAGAPHLELFCAAKSSPRSSIALLRTRTSFTMAGRSKKKGKTILVHMRRQRR